MACNFDIKIVSLVMNGDELIGQHPEDELNDNELLEKRNQLQRLNEVRIKRLYRNLSELQYVVKCLTPVINNAYISESYRDELNAQIAESLDLTRKLLKNLPGDGLIQ